ncbi:MAG: S8 family peptidase, partial [Pirellulales bacterium]|nr:S8 family peptidase [Pirellulales bacterium]
QIPDICYHGVLAEMSPQAIQQTVDQILQNNYSQLLRCEDVMFFRPFGQAGFPAPDQDDGPAAAGPPDIQEGAIADAEPVVALLDGLPLENHVLLAGRLIIDDPDDHQARYQPGQQRHGTAMASLILHGDLSGQPTSLQRPVYVRPIFIPSLDFNNRINEVTPDDELLVDLVHRSVRRIKEGDGDDGPAAPSVKIINLSFGNRFQPFDRDLSPLARLLDWLSWKYGVLFLVSAGNITDDIRISVPANQWQAISPEQLRGETLRAMRDSQVERRPLSPAEAVNVVTVGAVHADDAAIPVPDQRVDLLGGLRLPSPLSTVASGYNRAVKPEVLFPGGRQLYHAPVGNGADPARFAAVQTLKPPGQKVAWPGQGPMELGRTVFSRGTSNATALGTRCAAQTYEHLQELKAAPGGEQLDEESIAVIIKALLVHGASWGNAADEIATNLSSTGMDWRVIQRLQARFLGYGEVDPSRAMVSTDQRATIVGWGKLVREKAHVFDLPLPPSLSASKQKRRLTVTLAWLSPINNRHRSYRQAQLWFHVNENEIGVRKLNLDSDSARRGTVEHRLFEGEKVRGFVENQRLSITVSCKDGAGKCVDEVPYALAVTLEVAAGLELPIYQEIADRIRPKVEIAVNPGSPE